MAEHHQAGAGGQRGLQRIDYASVGAGLVAAQVFNRQHINAQLFTSGQFDAGRDNPGVLAVADQHPIAAGEGQSPQRQHASAGDVFGQGEAMGRHAAPVGQLAAGGIDFSGNEWPDLSGEWAEFLNAPPAGGDRL